MEIKYLGHSSFLIKTKTARIVTDPFNPEKTGLKFPKVEAEIITVSHNHDDHNQVKLVVKPQDQKQLIINMAGEYEKLSVRITGYLAYHDNKNGSERGENILYKIEAENTSILHCGDLGFIPDDAFIDSIGEVDILLVPTGGVYTIDESQAETLIKKIEPSIVIPMHYNHDKLNQQHFKDLSTVEEFTKKYGIEKPIPLPKLVFKKEENGEEMKVVVLEI